MKKAGIVMDAYKAPTFRKNLLRAGFKWQEENGPTDKILIFKVDYFDNELDKLTKIVKASNAVSTQRN